MRGVNSRRAWIALTVIWISWAGSIALGADSFCRLFDPRPWCDYRPAQFLFVLTLVICTPMVVLVIGAAVAWIAAGFRSRGRGGAGPAP
jgi:heme/copper-type cytochrome/quinol oxidase subunit 2